MAYTIPLASSYRLIFSPPIPKPMGNKKCFPGGNFHILFIAHIGLLLLCEGNWYITSLDAERNKHIMLVYVALCGFIMVWHIIYTYIVHAHVFL